MIDLQVFLPYQFSQLAETISRSVAPVYETRLGIARDDWRVLVAVNQDRQMRATDIAQHARLDKMQVSRAVARLEAKGFLSRRPDCRDKRQQELVVTASGRAAYGEVSPMMLARNEYLLQDLDQVQREALQAALTHIQDRARQLIQQG